MLEYDFSSNAGHWICMAAHLYQRAMNQELAPEGITYRQCQVLAWLALEGPLAQVELAERMNIEPPTLVRVLDRMERDGLLARDDSPDDRRRKVIRPLEKAESMWKTIVTCAESVRGRALAGMTQEQLRTLKDLLHVVEANLKA
jgi:MarR family transcriptional regulator for hemolysin